MPSRYDWQPVRPSTFSLAKATCVVVVATLLIASGWILPEVVLQKLTAGVREAVVWRPDSPAAVDARYRGNGTDVVPDVVSFWLFNITNVEAIRQGGKPRLEQVGPFVYEKHSHKVEAWWDRAGHVATKDYDYHTFVPDLSGASLDVPIVTLNMPLIGVVASIHASVDPAFQKWLDLLVSVLAGWKDGHVDGLFLRRTANELIWGYEDPLLQKLSYVLPHKLIPTTRPELVHNMTGIEEARRQLPVIHDTGYFNLSNVWNVESDMGLTEVTAWNNCTERVHGTDGRQFRPGLHKRDRPLLWVGSLFRAATLVFLQEVQLHGIKLLRFWLDPAMTRPEPCHFQEIQGLMNLTTPTAVGANGSVGDAVGPPVYISNAHFCLCDPSLLHAVEGLTCDLMRHTTYLDIEPITGLPMRAHKSVMLSSEIGIAGKYLEPQLDKAKGANASTITPIFWMEEKVQVSEDQAGAFKRRVYRALTLKRALGFWPPVAGLTLLGAYALLVLLSTFFARQLVHVPASVQHGADGLEDGTAASRAPLLQASSAGT